MKPHDRRQSLLRRRVLPGLLLASLLPGWALAQTLEFKQAVEIALSQNPELGIAKAQIEQAEAAVRQAEGNRLPRVNLSLTGVHTNDALSAFGLKLGQRQATFNDFGAGDFLNALNTGGNPLPIAPAGLNEPDAVTNFNPRVELLVPVYNGGMVQSYVDTAKAYVRATQSGDRHARQQLVKHVLMAYQGVHTARAYIKVTKEAELAAAEYVRITENLHKQGMAVKSDVLSAKVNLEEVRIKATEARNAEAAALDQLHLLLGKPLEEPLDVGAQVLPGMLDGTDIELRSRARENHAGLQAMRHQVDAAGAQVNVARAGKKPQFNVMVKQDWNSDSVGFDAGSYTVAGVLSWTAFDGGSSNAGIDRAEAQRGELLAKLRQAEDGVGYQVTEAKRKALEAETRIAARGVAVEQATEAQRLVKKRYENGVGTLIELLAAQAQLDKARADQIAAQYDLAVNRAELKRAAGVLAAEQI
ncbi:MAG: TolC family protein [Hydrogenophilales bacterium]|nr:TolC family protein [Hydrogenophilales bacterium]